MLVDTSAFQHGSCCLCQTFISTVLVVNTHLIGPLNEYCGVLTLPEVLVSYFVLWLEKHFNQSCMSGDICGGNLQLWISFALLLAAL